MKEKIIFGVVEHLPSLRYFKGNGEILSPLLKHAFQIFKGTPSEDGDDSILHDVEFVDIDIENVEQLIQLRDAIDDCVKFKQKRESEPTEEKEGGAE